MRKLLVLESLGITPGSVKTKQSQNQPSSSKRSRKRQRRLEDEDEEEEDEQEFEFEGAISTLEDDWNVDFQDEDDE